MEKKYSTSKLLEFVKGYIESLPYTQKVSASKIAQWANNKYSLVPELFNYNLTRDLVVKEYIENHNAKVDAIFMGYNGESECYLTSTIDTEVLFSGLNLSVRQKKAIASFNSDHERLVITLNKAIEKNKRYEKELYEIKKLVDPLQKKVIENEENEKELKHLKKIISKYKVFIKNYITDEGILEHLVSIGFLKKDIENSIKNSGLSFLPTMSNTEDLAKEAEKFLKSIEISVQTNSSKTDKDEKAIINYQDAINKLKNI